MSEVANPKIRNILKPIIELLNGIPSVVYGFFGLAVIVPLMQNTFDLPVGESGISRKHHIGNHGFTDNYYRCGRRDEQLSAFHARS